MTDALVIVDTSVWVDYFRNIENPQTVWLYKNAGIRSLALTDLILCECLQGTRNEDDLSLMIQELGNLELFATGGRDLAIASALNYRELRRQGHTVRKTIDCIVATFCIEHGHALLHRDRDYDAFEKRLGLRVVHPDRV